MPRLHVVEGSGAGTVVPVSGGRLTIGREADNDLVIEDPKSSRFHAEVVREGGIWHLHDLGSSNGTWTEDGRIESLVLGEGSNFRIGRTRLRFELGDDPEQTRREVQDPNWLDPGHVEGLKPGTDLFHRQLGGTTTQLARHNAYLVLLHQLVERSRGARSRDALFSLLDDTAAEVLDGDRVAVFLPVEGGWELWPPHERMLRARYGSVPFARTLLRAVRTRKEPLLCTLGADLNPSQSMVQAGVRSAMVAPLRIGEDLHALLYVDRINGTTPFTPADLEFVSAVANQLAVCLANQADVARLSAEISRLSTGPVFKPLVLVGPSLASLEGAATRVAASGAPCLVVGEAGTGKDLLARIIHQRSGRGDKPLQVLSCAGMDPARIEIALVGSATDSRPGVVELADRATLLVEEICDLPPEAQARLVRLIDAGEVSRIGDPTVRQVDVRLIVTSSHDLRSVSNAGRLRQDLVARLSAFGFVLPPLVDRGGDLDILIDHFLAEFAARSDEPAKRLSPEARTVLMRAPWPGNVGQLRQVLERACVLSPHAVIQAEDLPADLDGRPAAGKTAAGAPPITSLAQVERQHILRVLEHCGGNKKAAAEVLEIDRSTLYAKLRQYGLG